MGKTRVDIGIACAPNQNPEWWVPVFSRLLRETQRDIEIGQILGVNSALPDVNKNNMVQTKMDAFDKNLYEQKRRGSLTDANRNKVVSGFLPGNQAGVQSEWIMWLDDDTIPPDGFITQLLKANKPFIAGLYFLAREPYNPIAYIRDHETGWGYKSIYGYPPGSLFQVDSVGMGCTLIHRSVYQAIMDAHAVYYRPDGTLMPVLKSKIHNTNIPELAHQPDNTDTMVNNNWLCQRLKPVEPDDNRTWPFYQLAYVRTEDHFFCELAAAAGIRPWIDSTVLCEHIKPQKIDYGHYKAHLDMEMEMVEEGRK